MVTRFVGISIGKWHRNINQSKHSRYFMTSMRVIVKDSLMSWSRDSASWVPAFRAILRTRYFSWVLSGMSLAFGFEWLVFVGAYYFCKHRIIIRGKSIYIEKQIITAAALRHMEKNKGKNRGKITLDKISHNEHKLRTALSWRLKSWLLFCLFLCRMGQSTVNTRCASLNKLYWSNDNFFVSITLSSLIFLVR